MAGPFSRRQGSSCLPEPHLASWHPAQELGKPCPAAGLARPQHLEWGDTSWQLPKPDAEKGEPKVDTWVLTLTPWGPSHPFCEEGGLYIPADDHPAFCHPNTALEEKKLSAGTFTSSPQVHSFWLLRHTLTLQ